MKFLAPLLVLSVGFSAMAQYEAPLDPARQAERNTLYGPGYLTPGNSGVYQPSRPVPPPPLPPMYGDVGPQMTVRWQDNGTNRLPKLLTQTITVYVGGLLTNEVRLRAIDNRIGVQSAVAYLSDGRIVDLRALVGSIREGRELASLLDYRFSLRVNRIEITATSDNLIGSRAQIQVLVGLAQ